LGRAHEKQQTMRNWSVFTLRVGGIAIRIHVTFLILLIYLLLNETSRSGPQVVPQALMLAGLILVSVILHEIGHAVVSMRQGFPVKDVVLLPTGGLAMIDPAAQGERVRNLRRETVIALAGPLVNAFLAAATAVVLIARGSIQSLWVPPLVAATNLATSFFWINACLLAFNLLPAFPLDGGRILHAWLTQRMEFRQATRRAVRLGHWFAALFMMAGVWAPGLMLVGAFIFMAAMIEERTGMFQSVVDAVHMEDIMLTEFSILSPADTLVDALNRAVHSLQDDFPVVSAGDLVGVITRQTIVDQLRAEGNGYVQGAMSKAFEIASRTESLGSAFRKLTSRGLSLIPVVDQERLVGIVTLQHLMHSMGLLAESRRLRRQMQEQQ
jgi:Zn-dependent protease/CBS domain-containing protein